MDTVGTEPAGVITELKEAFQIDEGRVKSFLEEKMRGTIEETMNQLLDAEAYTLCQAQKYQRTPERQTTDDTKRQLPAEASYDGWCGEPEDASAAIVPVRDADHRAVSLPAVERVRIADGDVSGGHVGVADQRCYNIWKYFVMVEFGSDRSSHIHL